MKIKIATLKNGIVNIHLHHAFKITEGGFMHISILTLSLGKKGVAIHILGFSFGIGWKE